MSRNEDSLMPLDAEHVARAPKNRRVVKPVVSTEKGERPRKANRRKLVGRKGNSNERIIFDSTDVNYLRAHLSEALAYLEEEELVVRATLKELSGQMDPTVFAQTHRAYIVNIDKIQKVTPMFSGNFQITLKDASQTKVPLSRRYAKNLKKHLGNW